MKFKVHHEINVLLNHLIEDYQSTKESLGLFDEYIIAVPNASVENWFKQQVVEKLGICSGITFTSVYGLLFKLQQNVSHQQSKMVSKSVLAATLYKILNQIQNAEVDNSDELVVIKSWLNEQNLDESLAYLSHTLANTFELYQIYRSNWLDAWQDNNLVLDNHAEVWQAALWRLIINALPNNSILHRKQLSDELASSVQDKSISSFGKGCRQIMVFGINQIDEASIKQLLIIGQHLPVTYLWQAASVIPFGIKEQESNKALVLNGSAYFSDNRLLAAWGNSLRQQALIFEQASNQLTPEYVEQEKATDNESQLKKIQKAIFANKLTEPLSASKAILDDSITIAAHFSRFREVEGVYDYILEQFDNDKSLISSDFIILCPDINAYAPYIRSVFENQKTNKKIPFQLCGMNKHGDDVATLMLQLVSLPKTRYLLSDIIDLLNHNYIRQCFGLSTEDVVQIHSWLNKANVYWGLDKITLQELDLPEYDRYTLQSGIDRLVLGLSLDGESIQLDDKLLCGIEGISALHSGLLSKLINFVEQLTLWRNECLFVNEKSSTHSMGYWCERLRELTENFIKVPQKELSSLHHWFQLLSTLEKEHQEDDIKLEKNQFSFSYLLSSLAHKVDEQASISGSYRYGRLNIGSFGTLKGIPAKIIALLGMNEADFPRKQEVSSIDLTLMYPELGDRNRIEQDKDAFLMSLLNCQKHFYCSFVGMDNRSNSERIPSLVLQELLDYITPDEKQQYSLIQHHPMKPYSSLYFDQESLLSTYQAFNNDDDLLPGIKNSDITEKVLTESLPEWTFPQQLSLQKLKTFLEDPAKAFFQERFNLTLPDIDDDTSDDEPLSANKLTEWKYINDLLEYGMQHGVIPEEFIKDTSRYYCALGLMEHDHLAQEKLADWSQIANSVLENALLAKRSKKASVEPISISMAIAGAEVELVGELSLYENEKSSTLIQIAHKEGSKINDKYLMRAIVDTRVAEALKLESELPFDATYLACKNGLYKLYADSDSGQNSIKIWLELYKKVMNAPIALDLPTAIKLSKTDLSSASLYREAFDEIIADSNSPYGGSGLSEAMKLLSKDPNAIEQSAGFIPHFAYKKPGKNPEDESSLPYWLNAKDEITHDE